MSETMLKTEDPVVKNEAPVADTGQAMDDADAFIVERIAEAVVRKIDERDKINLLAKAVLERLHKLNGDAPAGVSTNGSNAPKEQANDDLSVVTAQTGGKENGDR